MKLLSPQFVITTAFAFLLSACSFSHYVGNGTVIREMKVSEVKHAPGKETDTGLVVGGGAGAAVGFAIGSLATLFTFGAAAPAIPMFVIAGGAVGGTAGAGTGYIYGVAKQGNGLFAYVVQPDNSTDKSQNILVNQYDSKPFAVGSHVKIMRKQQVFYIKKMD